MSDRLTGADLREMHERMVRVEVEAQHAAQALTALKAQIAALDAKLDKLGEEVSGAKVALKVGAWLSGFAFAAISYAAGLWKQVFG